MVAAIFVWPACRIRPIAKSRSVAIRQGLAAVLTWDAFSRNVTSRTQWVGSAEGRPSCGGQCG